MALDERLSSSPRRPFEAKLKRGACGEYYDITFNLDGKGLEFFQEAVKDSGLPALSEEREVRFRLKGRYLSPSDVVSEAYSLTIRTPRTYMLLSQRDRKTFEVMKIADFLRYEPGKGYRGYTPEQRRCA